MNLHIENITEQIMHLMMFIMYMIQEDAIQ